MPIRVTGSLLLVYRDGIKTLKAILYNIYVPRRHEIRIQSFDPVALF